MFPLYGHDGARSRCIPHLDTTTGLGGGMRTALINVNGDGYAAYLNLTDSELLCQASYRPHSCRLTSAFREQATPIGWHAAMQSL